MRISGLIIWWEILEFILRSLTFECNLRHCWDLKLKGDKRDYWGLGLVLFLSNFRQGQRNRCVFCVSGPVDQRRPVAHSGSNPSTEAKGSFTGACDTPDQTRRPCWKGPDRDVCVCVINLWSVSLSNSIVESDSFRNIKSSFQWISSFESLVFLVHDDVHF